MPPALTALIADYCATHPPAEYLGEPGDVLLWSSHTIHSGSSNLSDRPRIGAFTVRPPAPRNPQTLTSSPAMGCCAALAPSAPAADADGCDR